MVDLLRGTGFSKTLSEDLPPFYQLYMYVDEATRNFIIDNLNLPKL